MFQSFKPKRPIRGKKPKPSDKENKEKEKEKKPTKSDIKGKNAEEKNKPYDDDKEIKPKKDKTDDHWVELVVKSSPSLEYVPLKGIKHKIKSAARNILSSWKLLDSKGNHVKLSTDDLPNDGLELEKFPTRAGYLQTGIAVESDHDHTIHPRFLTGAVLPKYIIDPIYTRNRKIQTMEFVTEETPLVEAKKAEEAKEIGTVAAEATVDEKEKEVEKEEIIKQQLREERGRIRTGFPLNIYRIDKGAPTNAGSLRGVSIPRRQPKPARPNYKIKAEKVDALEMIRRWHGGRTQTIYKREEKSCSFDDFQFIKQESKKPSIIPLPSKFTKISKKPSIIPLPSKFTKISKKPSIIPLPSKFTKISKESKPLHKTPSVISSKSTIQKRSEKTRKPSVPRSIVSIKSFTASEPKPPSISKKEKTISAEHPKEVKQRPKSEPITRPKPESQPKPSTRPASLPPPAIKRPQSEHSIPSRALVKEPLEKSVSRKTTVVKPSSKVLEPSPAKVALSPTHTMKPIYSQLETPQRATLIEPSPTKVALSPTHTMKPIYSQLETPQRATMVEPSPSHVALSPTHTIKPAYSQLEAPQRVTLDEPSPSQIALSPSVTIKPTYRQLETPQRATLVEPSPSHKVLSSSHTIKPTYSQLEMPQEAALVYSPPAASRKKRKQKTEKSEVLPQYTVARTHVCKPHGICHCHPCMMCHAPCAIPFAYSFKYCSGIPCAYHRHQCASTCLRNTTWSSPCFHHTSCASKCLHHHSRPHSCEHLFAPRLENSLSQKRSPPY